MKHCITCHKNFNTRTGVNDDDQPKPGDISFCWCCGTMYEFDQHIGLRMLSTEEKKTLMKSDVRTAIFVNSIEVIIAARNKLN